MSALPDHVEISKRELRAKATSFAKTFADARSEAAEKQTFWNEFFAIFGVSTRSVGTYELLARRLSTGGRGFIDFLYPGEMAIEHKSLGKDLDDAMDQLVDYLNSLKDFQIPRLLVVCDFQNFYWKDIVKRTEGRFRLDELPKHVEMFWWLSGYRIIERVEDEVEANLVATEFMANLHDAVMASGYDPHALREWLTRILFCLFADDNQIWDRDAFSSYILLHTREDGSDLGPALAHLFQILNTPEDKRSKTLDEDLAVFTYINGDLFEENLPIPSCDAATRFALIQACKFEWSAISPAIFGSMFMNVMTSAERRKLGAEYTTEENILKTIRPLFLEQLEAELVQSNSRMTLDRLHDKLANLTFLDPACGCGNFLVIAYRELRRLESALWLKRMAVTRETGMKVFDVAQVCRVTVSQFYGIEIEEFPARIARTALYLMDHQSNLEFSRQFGQYFIRFPIPASPHIRVENALRFDWNDLLPASRADYVFGNPPFLGKQQRSSEQVADMELVFNGERGTGILDYVTAWYRKSMDYVIDGDTKFAFVSTNSITQGEQVSALWPSFYRRGFEITFAHRTFAWTSEAKGKAHVHCIIIGFVRHGVVKGQRELFDYPNIKGTPIVERVKEINCYLAPGPSLVVSRQSAPLNAAVPAARFGSMPNDGGNLLVDESQLHEIQRDPIAAKYLREVIGAQEMLNGGTRWCLWLVGAQPSDITRSPVLRQRVEAVRDYRLASPRATTRTIAATPSLFGEIRQPSGRYLCVPRVSSQSRRLVPMIFVPNSTVALDSTLTVEGAPLWVFAQVQSAMFMTWVRAIAGRLKSDFRISAELVYNTFPFADVDSTKEVALRSVAERILKIREELAGSTLAELYGPLSMPADLVKAHDDLDRVVDRIFGGRQQIRTEGDRLGLLFARYEALISPLLATAKPKRRR